MSEFDPYLKWLGIREATRPINHYRLLGLDLFESDPDVISMAADRQMTHIRTYQNGPNGDLSQQILNELARARRCLLVADKKTEYDDAIRADLRRPVPPVHQAKGRELAPPLVTPPPTLKTKVVDVDVVHPEMVESSTESKIGITTDENARTSTRRRERKQLVWSLFGWVSGGLAAIGIGAWLIGSGLLPNSNSAGGPDLENEAGLESSGQPVAKGHPKSTSGSTTAPGTETHSGSKPSTRPKPNIAGLVKPPKPKPSNNPGVEVAQIKRLATDSTWNQKNLASYPKASAETRVLLSQIAKSIAGGRTFRFEASGQFGGTREITVKDANPALLIGLAVMTDVDQYVKTVQPIFLGLAKNAFQGVTVGGPRQQLSSPSQPVNYRIGKPGYAVGELNMSVLDPIRCLRIKFMRITKDGLNPADFYWSDWVGSESGPVKTVSNDRGIPIFGFHSRYDPNSGVATLGLVGADEMTVATSKVPSRPLKPGPLNLDPTEPVSSKIATPSKRDRDKAMVVVDREYRDSIVGIRSIRGLRRVSQQLIFDGKLDSDDSDGQYARFEKARALGIRFGDAKTAVEALQAVDEHFKIDFWKEVLETIEDAELKANTLTQVDFKQTMDELVDEAIAQQQFGPAGRLIANASLMARRTRNVAAQDKYKNLRKRVVELGKLTEQAEKARGILLANPNDPEANLNQGDYLFVVADDSDAAFEFWGKSNVTELKDLVKKEIAVDKKDGDQRVGLAADWQKMGNGNRSARDRKCLERARFHYQAASRLLSGLARKAALSKTKELDQILN